MKLGYYPGCSLDSTAIEYNESIKDICNKLNIELTEIKDWNCCGASSAHCIDENAAFLLSARNLEIAESDGNDLVIPCSGCFSRLKFAEKNALQNPVYKDKSTFKGSIRVLDILTVLSDDAVLEEIKNSLKKPLSSLKVAAYYGCMSLRPPEIVDSEDCENPRSMEKIFTALGAEVVDWSFKSICCGGSLVLSRTDIVRKLVSRIFTMAGELEVDCLVTSCPMCQSNLDTRMNEIPGNFNIPVLFISEIIGLALDSSDINKWFKKHIVNPGKIFKKRGLM